MPTLEVEQALAGDVWLQGGNIQEDTSHISETTGAAGGRAAPRCLLSLIGVDLTHRLTLTISCTQDWGGSRGQPSTLNGMFSKCCLQQWQIFHCAFKF